MSEEPAGTNILAYIPKTLPQAVKSRAQAALGKLFGAVFPEVLATAQAAKDERDARSTIIAAIAKAAGEKAAADPAKSSTE